MESRFRKGSVVSSAPNFFQRNEFLLRRLHSLFGLVPVGAYVTVHLLVNASVFASPELFQRLVFHIHSLGPILPLVEWTFIFLPIIFHGVYGLIITKDGHPNTQAYPYNSNFRYTMQRATGLIAFLFIAWHVFQMHGWIHSEFWVKYVAEPLGGAEFSPYNAASSGAEAMQGSIIFPILYAIGVLAVAFHLANGIFTFGITWGLWVSPKAQNGAKLAANCIFVVLAVAGMASIVGLYTMSSETIAEVRVEEDEAYKILSETGDILPNAHKHSKQSEFYENNDEEEAPEAESER
ncbi:succinate dehydrogenase [Bremerella cremea]|uniref:Succinate dehydrogenase n=1 Tax=Blastopirellula marina TaxID=124 RepID=A0A2S8G5N8_9BACT|nr:succinate dehydrogenase [Blastopirellula marina]RCS51038.1 succinate dehydrogenase [Bremerella cremea]